MTHESPPSSPYRRDPRSSGSHPIVSSYDWPTLASAFSVVIINILVLADIRLPFVEPTLGFWFVVIHPVYLLYTTSIWPRSSAAERLGYSLATALILLLLGGLGINTFLPLVGVHRPLDIIPVLILADALNVALYILRRLYPAKLFWRSRLRALQREEIRFLIASVLCVAGAVLGANRLNNGAGEQVSVVTLGGITVTLLLLLLCHRQMCDGLICATLYFLSLALLLMTSLRGWYVTGHDIQLEYRVFQLTAATGHWSMLSFRNPFNACLSITILPTELARILDVANPYIYKVFFQIIFALCPVLVYTISRRYWSRTVSILAVVYFIGFPTFFTDMPFLNRQEIAFLFVSVGVLSIMNTNWSLRWRRLGLVVSSLGVELSHYSTMYLFLGTLVVAWVARQATIFVRPGWRERAGDAVSGEKTWAVMARTLSSGSLIVIASIAFLWGGLATQTVNAAVPDAESAISALIGHSDGARGGGVSYSLVSGATASSQSIINAYRKETLQSRSSSDPASYVSASVVQRYPTPAVNQPTLPLTRIGRFLSKIGIPASGLNSLVRQAAAKGEQLFVAIGLVMFLIYGRRRRQIGHEFFCLCVGSIVMVAIITVLPDLSVDYGLLRAFQEALILIAPILVIGSGALFRPLGSAWALRIVTAICLVLFVSTTGLLPQLLGGYPAQLSLANSGQYYDVYYVHPQEEAAVGWLANKPGVIPYGVQASFSSNRFAFVSPSDVLGTQVVSDIYPTMILRSSWVILGYSTVRTGLATAPYDGDLIPYVYPVAFLLNNKNLVYNNGGSEIFR
jgi:uncharacterized membrane protein